MTGRNVILAATAVLVAAATLTVLLTRSASPAVNDAPFGGSSSTGLICTPVPAGGVVTFDTWAFHNSGPAATIQKITLPGDHGLRVLAAWVVPVTGTNGYGLRDGWPAVRYMPAGEHWAERQRAAGAHIAHSKGNEMQNILVVLKPSAAVGRAAGLEMDYTSGGTSYIWRSNFAIVVKVKPGHC